MRVGSGRAKSKDLIQGTLIRERPFSWSLIVGFFIMKEAKFEVGFHGEGISEGAILG